MVASLHNNHGPRTNPHQLLKETTMNPTHGYHLATALIADDHARAERGRAARAAIRARRAGQSAPGHPAARRRHGALAGHALSLLRTRST
jgi:hypothetical protein